MISVDPQARDDVHFRYKMPAVVPKNEGSGNGVKTVIANIHDVCGAINRPESVLLSYMQNQLGTQSNISEKDDKYLIMGTHAQDVLQAVVDRFIGDFVLCKKCRNPETIINITGKRTTRVCGACGAESAVEGPTKTEQAMIKYYQAHPEELKAAKHAAKEKKEKEKEKKAVHVDTEGTGEVVAKEMEAPWVAGARLMKEKENELEELSDGLVRIAASMALKDDVMGSFFFYTIVTYCENNNCPDKLCSLVRKYAIIFRRFTCINRGARTSLSVDKGEEKIENAEWECQNLTLKMACETIYTKYGGADRFVVFAFLLFVEGIVRDKWLDRWAREYLATDSGKSSKKAKVDKKEVLEKMQPLLQWLDVPAPTTAAGEEGKEGEDQEEAAGDATAKKEKKEKKEKKDKKDKKEKKKEAL